MIVSFIVWAGMGVACIAIVTFITSDLYSLVPRLPSFFGSYVKKLGGLGMRLICVLTNPLHGICTKGNESSYPQPQCSVQVCLLPDPTHTHTHNITLYT